MNETRSALEPQLQVAEFVDLLTRSSLAERRPMQEPDTLAKMLAKADVIMAAKVGCLLVGFA